MQHVSGRRFKPAHITGGTVAWQNRKPGWFVRIIFRVMHAFRQQLRIPEQRQINQDRKIFGKRHVVGQPWPRQRHRRVMHQLVVAIHHTVMLVGRIFRVVEKQHFAGAFIDLGMGGNAVQRGPAFGAQGFQGERIEPVAVTALPERGHHLPCVHHHIGGRRIFHKTLCTPAGPLRFFDAVGDAGPDRSTGFLFRVEALGANKTIAVFRLAIAKDHRVQHAVAIEGVIQADGFVHLIFGIAQIDAVDVRGNLPDHFQIRGGVLGVIRGPRAIQVGMLVGLQGVGNVILVMDGHAAAPRQ